MSFFKKLTKEFEELKVNHSDGKKDEYKNDGNMASDQGARGYPPLGAQQPPYQGSYAPQQPSPYGNYQGYGSPPPPPQQYGAPQYGYAPPPPAPPGYANISAPAGWLAQFDLSSQRWFYIEKATGRTQWEAPPPQDYNNASRGYGAPDPQGQAAGYYPGAGNYDGGYGQNQYGGGNPYANGESEKKSGKGGMLLAAAGGLAVGAVGGALVANALDDDDEREELEEARQEEYEENYGDDDD